MAFFWKKLKVLGVRLLPLGVASCAASTPLPSPASAGPSLQPEVFFAGRTHSWGVLQARSGAPSHALAVHGLGQTEPDGTFRLDQVVTFDDGRVVKRTWTLRKLPGNRYRADLTDAQGEVRGEVHGRLLHLRYALKGKPGVTMEQRLYLQPDGRTVLNESIVRAFGVTVLRLSELITRDGPAIAGHAGFSPHPRQP